MTTEMVETFRARREVNLGWCKRQDGDFVHEYTSDKEIDPRARERLIRMGYIERRMVPQSELDAWRKQWDENERVRTAFATEGSSDEEGESSTEEAPDSGSEEQEEAPVISVAEETIEDLGPTEEEESSEKKAPAKKVVRTPRNSRRRS